MHRVYNSAFMHMLRDERNAEYRLVMKNTLEFDPEVLKRYVNFMNNPDEKPAVEQFGKGDKYFGICTLLATLPGLPMFGHGQIEGFAEKYGMEYRRAYYDEPIDEQLVARHEREIFPLLRRRAQFAEVRDFQLYDFVTDGGWVNEDVFAYSNGQGLERSLIVYHNRFGSTTGTVHESVASSQPDGSGGRRLVRRTLAEGLGLPANGADLYVTFREHLSGLEYVRPAHELRGRGVWLSLEGYGRQVFLDFQHVHDTPAGLWRRVTEHLNGRGVPSLAGLMDELILEPIRAPFSRMVNAGTVRRLLEVEREEEVEELLSSIANAARALGEAAAALDASSADSDANAGADRTRAGVRALCRLRQQASGPELTPCTAGAVLALQALTALAASWRSRLDEWRLGGVMAAMFRELDTEEALAWRRVETVRALAELPAWPARLQDAEAQAAQLVELWLADDAARKAIGVNLHAGVLWLRAEAFEEFVDVAVTLDAVKTIQQEPSAEELQRRLAAARSVVACLWRAAEAVGYRVDALVPALRQVREPIREPKSARKLT
ncbi:MAG TPA: alpha-amylase, partial [Chloroflexota bacterium]|nr:alpha-amylase [Chloroflexota bacterium]